MSFQNKMTPEQKRILEAYMEQYPLVAKITNRTRQERIRQNILWDKLVTKLNALGPPVRNKSEWRRTWACLKYKTKVKTPSKDETDDDAASSEVSDNPEDGLMCPKREIEVPHAKETFESIAEDPCPADTSHLEPLLDTSKATSQSINPRTRMKKYFDCFSESVLGLPEHLQLKCRNEIFAVITKYEEIANNCPPNHQ